MLMHKLQFYFFGIGDQIAATSIPENYFYETGNKIIIDDNRIWAFKYNPYVVFLDTLQTVYPIFQVIPDCRSPEQAMSYIKNINSPQSCSQAE